MSCQLPQHNNSVLTIFWILTALYSLSPICKNLYLLYFVRSVLSIWCVLAAGCLLQYVLYSGSWVLIISCNLVTKYSLSSVFWHLTTYYLLYPGSWELTIFCTVRAEDSLFPVPSRVSTFISCTLAAENSLSPVFSQLSPQYLLCPGMAAEYSLSPMFWQLSTNYLLYPGR